MARFWTARPIPTRRPHQPSLRSASKVFRSYWCRVKRARKWNHFDSASTIVTRSLSKMAARYLSLMASSTSPWNACEPESPYQVIELGLPYHMLREVLKQIEDAVETPLQGFGDLSVEAIMQVTGLPYADAILAKQREYDEPYLLQGPQTLIEEVCRQIVTRGLRWTKGGRLFHLMGENDKGEAASVLLRCYHRQQRMNGQAERIETVGIGDSINDAPLLAMVDYPILVQKPDGSYDPDIHLSWNDSCARHRTGGME